MLPQTPGLLAGDAPGCPAAFDVPCKHCQDVPKWEVRVPIARVRIAVPDTHQQVCSLKLGPASELVRQRRLSPTRFSGNEDDLAMSLHRPPQTFQQSLQFGFTANKHWLGRDLRSGLKKSGRLGLHRHLQSRRIKTFTRRRPKLDRVGPLGKLLEELTCLL